MPIFRRYAEALLPMVPTVLRRFTNNVLNLSLRVQFEAMDAVAQALQEYSDAWPIDTAPGWLLDAHWLPYHALQRNGLSDVEARKFIHAKRLLNKSWGSGDQALQIFGVLLPTTTAVFSYFAPKSWVVNLAPVDFDEAAAALRFLEKKPSPNGGGFSVAGDNGMVVVSDKFVLAYGSIYGTPPPSPPTLPGWYTSVYGDPGSITSGHAHVAAI